jgi:Acyl-coenzyme A:6-aminopenicillanic acid acyl-transferase
MKKIFFLLACLLLANGVSACFIMFLTDGNHILIANHEDWYARDAEVSFVPAAGKKMGLLYFDFASEGTAQGGMNTAGLFFDGTRTPNAPYPDNAKKINCHCYIWKKILEECATVDQAIAYVAKYSIPELEDTHILFADRTGHSVIMGVFDKKLQIHRNTHNFQLLTNFNITEPAYGGELPCPRFAAADSLLRIDSSATVANVQNILANTDQEDLTVYSNIYDLKSGEVYIYSVYSRNKFTRKIKINLYAELKKGPHRISIKKLCSRAGE